MFHLSTERGDRLTERPTFIGKYGTLSQTYLIEDKLSSVTKLSKGIDGTEE